MRHVSIVGPKWVAYGRKVAEATMTETACTVCRPDVQAEDPETHIIEWVPGELVLSAQCRVQRLGPQRIASLAQQQAIYADYLVALPYSDDDINVGDIVRVSSSLDETLPARKLRVQHVMVGSLVWERDLYCTDDMSGG